VTAPGVTLAAWRAEVEKTLAGASFDKTLVQLTPEGFALQPLYVATAVDPGVPGAPPFTRGSSAAAGRFAVCVRTDAAGVAEEVDGGADAIWIAVGDDGAMAGGVPVVVEGPGAVAWLAQHAEVSGFVDDVAAVRTAGPRLRVARVSTLAFHDAGADPADELALALATGVMHLRAIDDVALAAQHLWLQVAIGRDSFGELCKLRALRRCWHKLYAAAGAPATAPPPIHAVCAARTQSQHDPWVNMLRVTTEVFAAALGGAELITPRPFDDALGQPSMLGRRIARNTALVLRDESHLGRVVDPAGGAYYLEERTEALARAAWARFTAIERDGGLAAITASGALRDRLEASWQLRAAAIARRNEPVLGVSEFANLDEQLPMDVPAPAAQPDAPALRVHRDAEAFDELRERGAGREVVLLTLGPAREHRARAGFATGFFATAGVRAREAAKVAKAPLVCLCGSDERYAAEAVETARSLAAAGCARVVLAGRPGPLEPALREVGVATFIYVGCDVVATLTELLS